MLERAGEGEWRGIALDHRRALTPPARQPAARQRVDHRYGHGNLPLADLLAVDVEPPDARRAFAAPDIRLARFLERERQRVGARRNHAVRADHVARDAEVI